jgi:hypothetical protein
MNSLPKYIVSSTLEDPDWGPSTVLKSDVVAEVSKLKRRVAPCSCSGSRPRPHASSHPGRLRSRARSARCGATCAQTRVKAQAIDPQARVP